MSPGTYAVQSPVVLILFNRPDLTARVLDRIRQARPAHLYAIADGPRPDVPTDAALCHAARALIDTVDWPCEVQRDFAEVNLGLRIRIASGVSSAFAQFDRAIVLEDDNLPGPDFFRFCDEMLERYALDEQVLMITGTNLFSPWRAERQSYHFARRGNSWGWASWRRAWRHYDVQMRQWEQRALRASIRQDLGVQHYDALGFWFDADYFERKRWAMALQLAIVIRRGLCVVPSVNLMSNIGFRPDATLTTTFIAGLAELPIQPLEFPLRHPSAVSRDREYDRRYYRFRHPHRVLPRWLVWWLRELRRELRMWAAGRG